MLRSVVLFLPPAVRQITAGLAQMIGMMNGRCDIYEGEVDL